MFSTTWPVVVQAQQLPSADACQALCCGERRCATYTYFTNGVCYLRGKGSERAHRKAVAGSVSGIRSDPTVGV